jgi:hypothetical protein
MNIDSLARLIESSDVATLRTLAVNFLPRVGFGDAYFSDGPYDGGLDFVVKTQRINGQQLGIQLSVEKNWQKKASAEAEKASRNHKVTMLAFVTSRRIPEGSWRTTQAKIAKASGVNVLKYDSQSIATAYIRDDAVAELLRIFGIDVPASAGRDTPLSPQNEAVAALLVFGSDARDFLDGMFDSCVKAHLARVGSAGRDALIAGVLADTGLSVAQGSAINASIDRLLQSESVLSSQKLLSLSKDEAAAFGGLKAATEYEFASLSGAAAKHLADNGFDESEKDLILENLLALVQALVSASFQVPGAVEKRDQVHEAISSLLASRVGDQEARNKFNELADLVAESQFGRRVASVRLYQIILSSGSRILSAALGGERGMSIFLDTSVFIPMICGALFDPGRDRFGKSAADLFELLRDHEFSPVLPTAYLEEVAAHLVMACRDYRFLLEQGVDIERSTNAFVSHFSGLRKIDGNEALTFESYVAVFGLNLAAMSAVIEKTEFYRLRDRAIAEFRRIAKKYGIETRACDSKYVERARKRIEDAIHHHKKTSILVEHDASVISYLEDQVASVDDVLILCTWDRMHSDVNPRGGAGYFVMSPPALIDFLAIGKRDDGRASISELTSFADAVSEAQVVMSAEIWDAVAKISGGEMSDGAAIAAARQFREEFLIKQASIGAIGEADIADSWIAWRKARVHADD